MKTLYWLVYTSLSLVILPLNWLRHRVKHGPSARLWLASDEDLLSEVKKRGLAKRQRAVKAAPEQASDPVDDPEILDAIKLVSHFESVPSAKAREAVLKAMRQFPKNGRWKVQELSLVARTLAN